MAVATARRRRGEETIEVPLRVLERRVEELVGLTILKKTVEEDYKGTVSVESRVGEGSTFTLHFPIAPSATEEGDMTRIGLYVAEMLGRDRLEPGGRRVG